MCNCSRYNATGSRCQIVHNMGTERDNICRTWGQYHYETFDGLYYFFSGKSTYVLVRQSELDEQSFSIQIHNDPECSSFPYSCKRSISLYFSGEEEIRLSSEVTYKGIGIQLPYTIGKLHIQKIAGYVIVRHQYAFSLAWDGVSAVYIKMAPDYLGKTHGLCGNNNAILQDELSTSYGKITEDIEEFVESWRENPPQENIRSWGTSFSYEPPCLTQTDAFLQRTYILCSVLLWFPFKECHEFVSPFPFMASCTNDLFRSGSGIDNTTWCRALTEYARTCAQAGKPLHEWRAHFEQCVVKCEEHLVYNECIDCCPFSCRQKTHCVDSELPCVDGCYCPDGLIYEDRLCVRPIDCPCDYHGTIHRTGAVIQEECNNCTCSGGKWICTNLTCPAQCSVSGDIHFMTFDGRKFTFQAPCQYILAKSRVSDKFAVTLQNAPCGQNHDGTCIQSISLIFSQDFRRQVTLTHSGDVLVHDQYKVNLPYIDDSFEIRKLSVFLQIKSYIGLQILYDWKGLRLYLEADAQWKDDTIGLCGTFNGNTQDDFLSPVGVPETTPQLFGNSWKTSSSCSPGYDSSSIDPCDVHLQAAAYATEACSIITKELFAPCYTYLSPLPYFEQCRRDTCKCGQICMCSALSHYAHLCHRFGVEINFRRSVPECALSCEDTKEYSTCVSTCGRSCRAFSVPEACNGDCVEGCTCPSGLYLNIKTDRCVPQNECPCYFHGIDYPPGENIITSFGKCNPPTMELGRERTCENQLLNITMSAQLPCFSGCMCPTGLFKYGDMCFKPNECPCTWKGKEYFPGDKVISSCHTCICSHGSFKCNFHPCPSMCTTYGDRHYRTFDGLSFDYVGNCKVYLVKSSSTTSFSVIIENVNCFNIGIICRKYISINVGKSLIIFDDDTGDPSHLSYIDKLQQVYIWKAGFFTIVHFPNEHITVMWDQRTTVHVETGPQWQGELTGLCGNFDAKTINEMRTPENFELTNAQEFGSAWAAVECVDSSDIRHPCILNPLREAFAKKECGILLSEIFESCHPVVDVTWFYSNCLIDTCGCNQGGDCECFCTSVSAYAHQCCQQGVTVDWRSPRLCLLGKGPYKLVSYLDGETIIAAKLQDGSVFPAREDDLASGDALTFMLTSPLYKPKAHDPHLVSLEAADRPNYFLYLTSNNTLVLSKWERNERFQNRSTFAIHKNTWFSGYSSFESFAIRGMFIHISASSVTVIKYHHSEAFRFATLFKLVDSKFKFLSRSTCEWRYDACSSPCFKTCKDPLAKHCQTVPKVEGCVPMCPLNLVLDELTQRCVYFEDCTYNVILIQNYSYYFRFQFNMLGINNNLLKLCYSTLLILLDLILSSIELNMSHVLVICFLSLGIEPTTEVQILPSTLKTHTAFGALQSSAAVLSKEIAFSVTPASKLRETTPASKQQFSSTTEKAKLSTFSLPNITLATSALSVQSAFDTSVLPGFSHLVTDFSPLSVVPSSTTDVVTLDTLRTSSMTSFSIPSTSTITEAESKLAATPTSIVTPSSITEDKSLDTSKLVSKIKEIGVQSFPTEDIERKLQNITESQTSSIVTSKTERTSQFFTKATLPSSKISSRLPTTRQTTPSRTKPGVTQPTLKITSGSKTSFVPLFTTLVATKPVLEPGSSETSKTTVALIKEQLKSTIIPITPIPTQLPHTFLTHPSVFASTIKKEILQTTSNITYQTSSYFSLYTPIISKPQVFTSELPRKTDISSPTTIVSKKHLQTEQSLFVQPNMTKPVTASSYKVTPLSAIVTSKTSTSSELSIPISQKIFTEHKIPLLLKTTKATVPDSAGITKSKTESALIEEVIATVPVTENDCIKHICLDGQLIQVNQSQYCPYSATQPSCGILGFAVQINGDKCCPKWECACRCTFFSDLSFITFDGHHVALFKEASYIISQTQDEIISIHVVDNRNTNMGILTYSKLSLAMLNLTYLSNQIIIDQLSRKIVVNSKYAWPTVKKYGFKIEDTGFMYLIKTPTNTKIQWFHNTGMMIIEYNATSDKKTMGLCGFCDGISTNDLMLPNNTVVRTAAASVIFTDSWLVPETLKYIGEPRTHEANCSAMDCSFCLNMLLSQTFSSCHPYVSPASFCDLWIQDSEYIQDPCLALSAYVAMCNKFNICIEWRNSSNCSFPCPEGFTYKACIYPCLTPSACQNTESTVEDADSCLVLTEGCTCAEGTVLHQIHSALCIPEEKCACTDHSGVPHAVGEIWKTSSSDCCMHKCVDSDTITAVEYNCSVNYDVRCQRFGEVALIVPDDQSCCLQKVCTCNQSLCDTLVPECKVLEKLVTYYQDNSCCPNYTCECDPEKCKSMEQIPHCRSDQTLVAAHVEGTCCFSYICSCGICSDQIPLCQEGERLTVDGNTTDRCCPDYQCVCEIFRCPEFKCMLGMSLIEVWSPEKCCPYRRCGNDVFFIYLQGEKMVLDEKFQNNTENVCHCTKYKCSKDKVCLNNERGVLLPGQSIVEHSSGGICHTSYCTSILDPVTKFYQMNTSIIDCAARCKSHQVYERPKDLTTCCGKCKNVSCVHTFTNGTISYFKPGSSWTLNCLKYDCINTPVGSILITSPISCPPFNETECVKIGGYIVPFLEGCCKTCKEDGKFCKKVTVRMTIRKNDCRSNTPVNIVSCDGKCPSASIYNYNINTYARFCKCCRELGLHRRTVQLYCSGNSTWVSYTIQEPTDCSCQWS
uniref:Otogelin n=1 Tax=Pseudonaja textilis TaxID=8673 RepID=A0A670XPF3_PSETE